MPKPSIHPDWYPDSKVFCDGVYLFTFGATKPKLRVDYWSSTCPFYTGVGDRTVRPGQLERFVRKYGGLFAFFYY
jgi:large subunit ribosomal protein L31